MEEEVQIDDGDTCVWIDTDPDEVFYDADEMEEYYDEYTNVWLMVADGTKEYCASDFCMMERRL